MLSKKQDCVYSIAFVRQRDENKDKRSTREITFVDFLPLNRNFSRSDGYVMSSKRESVESSVSKTRLCELLCERREARSPQTSTLVSPFFFFSKSKCNVRWARLLGMLNTYIRYIWSYEWDLMLRQTIDNSTIKEKCTDEFVFSFRILMNNWYFLMMLKMSSVLLLLIFITSIITIKYVFIAYHIVYC